MRNGIDDETLDRSGNGQQGDAGSLVQGVKGADALRHDCPEGGCGLDEPQSEEEIKLLYTQWSGELPHPEVFAAYPEYVQRAMVEWNNARVIDESKRLDRIVDAAVVDGRRRAWITFLISSVSMIASSIAFVITGSVLALSPLSVPTVTIAVNIAKSIRDGKDDSE